jgi:hypothetical protein
MKAVTVDEVVQSVSSLLKMWEAPLDRGEHGHSDN